MVEKALVYVGPPDILKDVLMKVMADNPSHIHVFIETESSPAEVLEAAREAFLSNISVGVSLHVLGREELLEEVRRLRERGISRILVADRADSGISDELMGMDMEVVPVEL